MKVRGALAAAVILSSMNLAWGADTPASPGTPAADTQAAIVVPTMDEIKKMMDDGKWMDALKGISRALPQTKKKDSGYDEYTLHLLSGECQLQQRNNFTAISEYETAVRLAKTKDELALPFATKTLVEKRDSKWRYVPTGKNADKDGIDLLDRTKREEAIKALAADTLADIRAQARKVQGDRALPPVVQLATSLTDARKIIYASTKSEDDIDAIVKALATHAQGAVTAAINDMQRQVDDIGRRANEVVRVNQTYTNAQGQQQQRQVDQRRGLGGNDAQVLQNNIRTCQQIPGAVNDLRKVFGDKAANFNNLGGDADRVANRANNILRDDYTRR